MSIWGAQKTALKSFGFMGKPEGRRYLLLMLELNFTQQLAGQLIANFCEPTTIYPAQFTQAGDEGIRIIVTVIDSSGNPVDLSTATSKQIIVKAPDLTVSTLAAAFISNGMDGKMYIELDDTALTEVGYYFVQAKIVIGGQTKSTRVAGFHVKANLA